MSRATLLLAALAIVAPAAVLGQHAHVAQGSQGAAAKPPAQKPMPKMTDTQKITNAMSAAPALISKVAHPPGRRSPVSVNPEVSTLDGRPVARAEA